MMEDLVMAELQCPEIRDYCLSLLPDVKAVESKNNDDERRQVWQEDETTSAS